MALNGVLRAGLVQMRVLDMKAALKHYRDILGLYEVCTTEDGRVCLKGWDEFDHHSVVLRETDTAGLDFIGFKVENDAVLTELAKKTKEFGFPCEEISANSDQPGYGRRFAVQTSTGHRVDLFAETELSDPHPQILNPDIYPLIPHGMGVSCFDHALLYGPDAATTVKYFNEVLGFSIAETVSTPDGEGNLCAWLTNSNRPHDVAILDYDKPGKVHHIGFRLENWNQIGHAADLISIYDISLDAGPMRHGVTRGQTIYFFDPSGNRNEVYAGGYVYYPDMPQRKWNFEQVGKGIFYYDRQLNDRFLAVVT